MFYACFSIYMMTMRVNDKKPIFSIKYYDFIFYEKSNILRCSLLNSNHVCVIRFLK